MESGTPQRHVVTAFLAHDGLVLLLRRSDRVRTYKGFWAGVSGSIEAPRSPREQALTEIEEETALARSEVSLRAEGEPLAVVDAELGTEWVVHPFLFEVAEPARVRLDWEHTELEWVEPGELARRRTVPGLAEALARVMER